MEILILFKYLFFFIVNFVYFQADAACPDGWFGSNCQYLCRCDGSNTCNDNGQCSTKCASGWFGQTCQYQDLVTISEATVTISPTQTTTTWLTDGSDTTCNTDTSIQLVKISWNTSYPFTWLRIMSQDANPTSNLILTFKTASNQTLKCINQQTLNLDTTTVDYRCDLSETIQELTVTGTGLKSLCSIYISGGRNVAVKQTTQQTSTGYDAARAVDGNPNGQYVAGTCTHTSDTDTNPSWTLTFDSAKVVNRYVLYNRADCCSERLKNFKLETMFLNNTVMWTYQDTRETLLVYTVTEIQKTPVSKIRITATNKVFNKVILTLCEVMVFGDCAPGTWGLDCNKTCPQKCSTSCHQETGQCVDCIGYSNPPLCTSACLSGYYGLNCQNNCSYNCYNSLCNATTGVCTNGCNGYIDPPQCTTECLQGSWGTNCTNKCSVYCYNNSCDRSTGVCNKGCNGFSDPPNCTEACPYNKWGPNCTNDCGSNCFNQACTSTAGVCNQGCNGYSDPSNCTIGCVFNKWGLNCNNTCSTNCFNQSCGRATGVCSQGCLGYSNPPSCTSECLHDYWGLNCNDTCSSNCYNTSCDRLNGVCDKGCNGYSDPPLCTQECDFNKWGENCVNDCGINCFNQSCNRMTGICNQGCLGNSETHIFEKECISNSLDFGAGIGIGVGIGAASIILVDLCVVFIWFKRNKLTMHEKMNKEGRELENHDKITESNNYRRPYERINSLKTNGNTTIEQTSSAPVTSVKMESPYDNEVNPQYESLDSL
ncbi:hypothetical protein Btru_017728 [Bulinus truncatus]|nr:hypothetical protein Btru_017728 [Bulinus truncatus]